MKPIVFISSVSEGYEAIRKQQEMQSFTQVVSLSVLRILAP